MPKRVLIVAATTGYQTRVFADTARRSGFEAVMATDRCHHLDDPWGENALAVRFDQPQAGAGILAALSPKPDGIIAVGDRPTEIAAITAERIGLRFHPHHAVVACRNKFLARERFRAAGLPVPEYRCVPLASDPADLAKTAVYPCVLKPIGLSGSRGVIRVNNGSEFLAAFERIHAILRQPDVRSMRASENEYVQIETYIPGRELALEGLVSEGTLTTLAIFDKPDPLDGPFFEETIYITPSREPASVQTAIIAATQRAIAALGLTDGPVHAEMRVSERGVYMLEVAARPIGGLCAQALRFTGGVSFEELLLRFAVGEDTSALQREPQASGVMMIPIPASGIYRGVAGVEAAQAVTLIDNVIITARAGQRLLQLPEGASYLGFIFARAGKPEEAEAALRASHNELRFDISPELISS